SQTRNKNRRTGPSAKGGLNPGVGFWGDNSLAIQTRQAGSIPQGSARAQAEGGFVFWLVQADFAAAGQADGRLDSPPLLANLCAFDVLVLQPLDFCAQIVAHQVKHSP